MVQRVPQQAEAPAPSAPIVVSALIERLRALMGVYQRLNELMGGWGDRSEQESDAAVIAVAHFYQDLCRDLKARLAEVARDIREAGLAIDLKPLASAMEHLTVVVALKAENYARSRQDIKEGRTLSLEQMRRELRNPAH